MLKSLIFIFTVVSLCASVDVSPATTNVIATKTPLIGLSERFYVSKDELKNACLVLDFYATINVNINKNAKSHTVVAYINSTQFGDKVMHANGSCGISEQTMTILWPAIGKNSPFWELSGVVLNNLNKTYNVSRLTLQIPVNAIITDFSGNETLRFEADPLNFVVDMGKYFSCKSEFIIKFKSDSSSAEMSIKNIQLVAFRGSGDSEFPGSMMSCPNDVLKNNIVPLVVGGVLAAMVVIVIITYLIGRSRHRRNYQAI